MISPELTAQTKATLHHRLKCFADGDIDGIMSDFADDAVLIGMDGLVDNLAENRKLFGRITEFPGSTQTLAEFARVPQGNRRPGSMVVRLGRLGPSLHPALDRGFGVEIAALGEGASSGTRGGPGRPLPRGHSHRDRQRDRDGGDHALSVTGRLDQTHSFSVSHGK